MKKRILAGLLCILMMLSLVVSSGLAETLRYGSQGSQVTQAQARLAELGFYKDTIDGKFGYTTYLAVKAFQEKNSLKVDGIIGENTNLALFGTPLASDGTASTPTLYQRIAYGSEGPAVKTVQGILRNLGYYTSDVEGKFGYSTFTAVKKFQTDKGLKADGVVGPETWAALTGGLVPPTAKPTAAPVPPTVDGIPWVKYNDVSPLVLQLQQKLNSLGYYVGEVDDRFGWLTYEAVRAFQKANGLQVDGIVGPATWNKLFGANPVPVKTPPPVVVLPTDPPAPAAPAPIRLQYGYTGELVGQLQTRLFYLGYLGTNIIDSVYGYETYQAVRAFQKRNSLAQDGIVGPNTWSRLFSAAAVPAVTAAPVVPVPPAAPTPTPKPEAFRLQYGDSGSDVAYLQNRLNALGYLAADKVDSVFGYATTQAVRAFQTVNKLTSDGIVGPKTWAVIKSPTALPKPTPAP